MPLKLRPTGLGSGIDKDRPDYTAFYRRAGDRALLALSLATRCRSPDGLKLKNPAAPAVKREAEEDWGP